MMILLTGGSSCGKSTYGESLAVQFPEPRYYFATMRVMDDETKDKVIKHRRQRLYKGFITIEKYTDIHEIEIEPNSTVLLECMCNLTANEMFTPSGEIVDIHDKILEGIESVASQCKNLIIVTNDIGSDVQSYSAETLKYIDVLGRLNNALAERSDIVYELVCGIPVLLKG